MNLLENDGTTPFMRAKSLSSTDDENVKLVEYSNAHNIKQSNSDRETQLREVNPFSIQEILTKLSTIRDGVLKIDYSPDKHDLWGVVKDNQRVRILEIDSRNFCPVFLNESSFYTTLNNATNLFLVDLVTAEGNISVNDEIVKNKLKNIEKPLIIQFRSLINTTVYIQESNAKEPIALNLNVSLPDRIDESIFIEKLSDENSFGLALVLKAIESGLIGEFQISGSSYIHLRRIIFKVNKQFDSWKLIDYAVRFDNFLLTRFLSLYDWDLKKRNEASERTIEIAAKYASVETLAALLDLQLPLPVENISISKNIARILKLVNLEGDTPLLIAAKNGKRDNVDFFIRCGAVINHRNKIGKAASDLAWENNYYDTVLTLLEADSDFPKDVNFDEVNEAAQKLKIFYGNREKLHTLIMVGNLEEVKKFVSSNKKSVFYLNNQNISALCTTIEAKQYEIYAFFKSIGANFKDEQEGKCIDTLTELEKHSLKHAMVSYFYPIENSHILYLVSKSRSSSFIKNFKDEVESLYRELDSVPEISVILKVVQYCDYVDIIFDFNKESTTDVDPLSSKYTRGKCDYKIGRLYIGAKLERAELLGTLAHELTHLAMQIKYNNDCYPYDKSECEKEALFKGITLVVKKTCESTPAKIDEIIRRVFTVYKNPKVWPSELVVRVPHLYAKYGREKGKHLIGQQVPQLLDYYEKTVVPDCEVVIQKHFLIKPRNNIRLLNRISGIITNILGLEIQFEKSVDLGNFLNDQEKNILLLNTKSTLLSCINIYQYLNKTPFYSSSDSYILVDFDFYNKQQHEIYKALYSEASNLLVVQYHSESDTNQLMNVLINLSNLLNEKSNKKIIFVIQENYVSQFKDALNEANLLENYSEKKHKQFAFKCLSLDSQKKLLKKEVVFQGKKINLNEIVDETSKELIVSETLVKLVKDDEIKVGNEITTSRGYDKDYYIDRTFSRVINIKSTIFKAKEKWDLLAVSGSNKATICKLMSKSEKFRSFKEYDPNKNNPIRFIVLDNNEAANQFKELCKQYPAHNIHWLKSEAEKFIWQESQGTISHLIKYIEEYKDHNYACKDTNLKEQDLLTNDNQQKIVIISDTAGMGKSTVLTNLITHIKNKSPNQWVVRVDLNNYSRVLDEELEKRKFNNSSFDNDGTNGESAVEFLLHEMLESCEKSRLKTIFEKDLFKHSFEDPGKIIVMFDGFDEISPTYKEIVMNLLRALKYTAVDKLLITTRPSMRQELEDNLEVFAYSLEPFSEKNQVDFLTNYWKKNLCLNCINQEREECLGKYAEALIDKFGTSIGDREKEFTGIPLQMKILAELFQENREGLQEWQGCKEFLEAYNENEVPNLPATLDLFGLYKHFVKAKFYDISLQEKQIIPDITKPQAKKMAETSYKEFIEKHKLLALHRLFGDKDLAELICKEEFQKVDSCIKFIKNCEENQGIIDQIIDDKAHFIHLTFAEYFGSFGLVEKIFSKTNIALKCINNIIAYASPVFINCIIDILDTKKTEVVGLLEGKTLLNLVTIEGHLNFSKTLLEAGYDNYPEPDHLDKTPLHYAAQYGHSDIVKYLLKYNDDILEDDILEHGCFKKEEYVHSKLVKFVNKKDKDGKTAIYYAAVEGNVELACDLLLKGADSSTLRECIKPITLHVAEQILPVFDYKDHKLRPIAEKLLIQAPDAVSHFYKNGDYPRLLSYFFEHGRIEVIESLLSNVNSKRKRKKIFNAIEDIYTPLDRVNQSSILSDDDRLAITKYLLKNGSKKTLWNIEGKFKNIESSEMFITNIVRAASRCGHARTFEYFIDQEHVKNFHIHLYWAADFQQLKIVQYLFEYHRHNVKHDGNGPLHIAVSSRASLKIIKYLIDNGEDINARNDLGETPLLRAVLSNRRIYVIIYLIKKGANVNVHDKKGKTPLYYAIENDQQSTVKYLLSKCEAEIGSTSELIQKTVEYFRSPTQYNLNSVDQKGISRLHNAIQSNDAEWSKFIIRRGGDVNIKDPEGRSPLHYAAKLQQTEIVELLLQYGAIFDDTDINSNTPLELASQASYMCRLNLRLTMSKATWLLCVLNNLFCSRNLMQDLNKQLLEIEPGSLVKHWGPYGDGYPYEWDFNNPMRYILNARNVEGKSLLHIAADTNDTMAIKVLLEKNNDYLERKAQYQKSSRCADYTYSTVYEMKHILSFYNYQSISIDAIDYQGNTPLHLAAQKGYDKVVSFLLESGAIFNGKNNHGDTPQSLAEYSHHDHIVKLLRLTKKLFESVKQKKFTKIKNHINKGAYVNAKDENGRTSLHLAASSGQSDAVQFLLKHGANIAAVDINNLTPLHFATERNEKEVVKLLLRNGATFNAKDKQEKPPFELKRMQKLNSSLASINEFFNGIPFLNGSTSLHLAASSGKSDFLPFLVKHSTNIESLITNLPSLHFATDRDENEVVKLLLRNGAFNAKDEQEKNPFELESIQNFNSLLNGLHFDNLEHFNATAEAEHINAAVEALEKYCGIHFPLNSYSFRHLAEFCSYEEDNFPCIAQNFMDAFFQDTLNVFFPEDYTIPQMMEDLLIFFS